MINHISAKLERAVSLLALMVIALFVTLKAQAVLPGPTSVAFDKGALFTVDGYTNSVPLSGFPVLVRIAANSPSGFFYTDLHSPANGADIAFVDTEGNGLPFEIDTWDPLGTSLIWVKLSTMTNRTQFVMCWGSATSGKTVCNESPFADYVGVWHMSEASGSVADSTGHGLAAVPAGSAAATASGAVAGKVGNGRECASQAFLSIANDNALDVGNAFAVSGWFDMSSSQSSGDVRFFSRKVRSQSTNSGWEVIRKSGDIATRGSTGDNIASYTPSPSFAGAGWKLPPRFSKTESKRRPQRPAPRRRTTTIPSRSGAIRGVGHPTLLAMWTNAVSSAQFLRRRRPGRRRNTIPYSRTTSCRLGRRSHTRRPMIRLPAF